MITPAFICLFVGMLVAQRFKVLILLPIILLSLAVTIGGGIARAETPWAIVATSVLAIVAVQIGYLLGIAAHHLMVSAGGNAINSGSVPSALSRRRAAHGAAGFLHREHLAPPHSRG